MNFRLSLTLMTIPTLFGSLLALELMTGRASAVSTSAATILASGSAACDVPLDFSMELSMIRHQNRSILIASAVSTAEEFSLDFSAAESDAAVVLFGCDCPACIRALRQLQNQSLFDEGSGHCWTSLQRRVSPQRMQDVLQNLEMQEAEQVR